MFFLLHYYLVVHLSDKDAVGVGTGVRYCPSIVGDWFPWYCMFVVFLVPVEDKVIGLDIITCAVWIGMVIFGLLVPLMWIYQTDEGFWNSKYIVYYDGI